MISNVLSADNSYLWSESRITEVVYGQTGNSSVEISGKPLPEIFAASAQQVPKQPCQIAAAETLLQYWITISGVAVFYYLNNNAAA